MNTDYYWIIYLGLPVLLTLFAGAKKIFSPEDMYHLEWKEILFAPILYAILLAACLVWIASVIKVVIEILGFVF